jgi:hypothetical protein
MNLIRRRKPKTPLQQGVDIVRLTVRALVAQRLARRAVHHYKFARRLPYLIGGAVALAVLAKVLKSRGDAPAQEPFQPPAPVTSSTTSPAPAASSATGPPPAAPEAPASPAVADTVDNGAPTPGGPELGGPGGPPPGEAPAPELSTGEPATEPELEVEAPNESTPPPATADKED